MAGAAIGADEQPPQGASQPQAGSQQEDSQPQAGSAAQPQLSQPLSQQLLFLQPRLPKSLSRRQPFFLAHGSQQLSQAGASQPQAGSHEGAHPQAGASQPQAGSHEGAHPQAGASHPQAGSHEGAHPQAGASHPQAGSHEGASQQLVSQQLLALPQPLQPSIRSKRSNPKLWVQMLQPRTRAIVIIVRFIGATSPFSNSRVVFRDVRDDSTCDELLWVRGAFGGRSRRRAHLEIPRRTQTGRVRDTRPADFAQLVDPVARDTRSQRIVHVCSFRTPTRP